MPKRTILVVEDSHTQQQVLTSYLTDCCHEVIVAGNGREALCLAGSHKPDLVLMDIDMPLMNGLDACRILTRDPFTHHIPVVMLSACKKPAARLRATMRGASEYLTKPVTQRQLCHTLSSLLEESG